MGKTLDQKLADLSPERRARVEARTAELVAEEMTLQELRRAQARTQVQVARRLKVGQVAVSRLEQRADLMLSTLSGYLKAMGGQLELRAVFKDRPAVLLKGFGELNASRATAARKTAKAVPSEPPATGKAVAGRGTTPKPRQRRISART